MKKNGRMKKLFIMVLSMVLAMALVLTGCGNGTKETKSGEEQEAQSEGQAEETKEETPSEEAEPNEGETTEDTSGNGGDPVEEPEYEKSEEGSKKRKEEYIKALRNYLENQVTPDGKEIPEEVMFSEFNDNQFAILDIDGDGEEELIFSFLTAPMAGVFENVYYYNVYSESMVSKLYTSPYNTYYTDGFVEVNASHNHSLSGSFWPYMIYHYSEYAGEYVPVGSVSAWDKEYFPKDFEGNDFPDDADLDKDGTIYYISEGSGESSEDYVRPEPVDVDVYEAWRNEIMKDAKVIEFPRFNISAYNIDQYEKSDSYITSLDDYEEYTLKDLKYYLPKGFLDKVDVKENEVGITFYHKGTRELEKKIYGTEERGRLGTIAVSNDTSYLDIPHYKFLTANGESTYIIIFPTDVQLIVPQEIDSENGSKSGVTEEEIMAAQEEYMDLYEVLQDIHPELLS